jgi:VCBS repeat-containing protein
VTSVSATTNGGTVVDNNDGTVTYDPNGAFEALAAGEDDTDTFTYTITDADGATDTATVTVTVNGINDPPVAVDDNEERLRGLDR